MRQSMQSVGHLRRIDGVIAVEHLCQSEFGGSGRSDELFGTGLRAGYEERGFVERQNLAKRVVAAHADQSTCFSDDRLKLVVETDDCDIREKRGPPLDPLALFMLHEGARYEDKGIDEISVMLTCGKHHRHDVGAIAAATGSDNNEIMR